MPRSKRNKQVALTKVKKKSKDEKDKLIDDLRQHASEYPRIMLVRMENDRGNHLKDIRRELAGSKLVFAKNTVMQKALGVTKAEEAAPNIHKLCAKISEKCALLFTKETEDAIAALFARFTPEEYARAGFVATESITLPQGPHTLSFLSHSIEPYLRQLGMPTLLKEGKIHLLGDYKVCAEGKKITQDQAQVLKLINRPLARFRATVDAVWDNGKVSENSAMDTRGG